MKDNAKVGNRVAEVGNRAKDKNYWASIKIMVTGGSGFLGKRLVGLLLDKGARNIFVPRSKEYNLTDPFETHRLFYSTSPDIVFHLAARTAGIAETRRHPADFYYDNLTMGTNVIHQSWTFGVQKLVLVSSVCAYPKYTPIPFREEDLWNGYPEETNAPYGLAKRMLSVQSQAYRDQYGFNSITIIPTNIYGPGDKYNPRAAHVIADMTRKFYDAAKAGDKEVVLWGDGSPTRDFLYVDDAARALIMAAEKYDGGEPVNIGSGVEVKIRDLADMIAAEFDYTGEIVWDSTLPNGQPRRAVCSERARVEFGFEPAMSLADGIRLTTEWYKGMREGLWEE